MKARIGAGILVLRDRVAEALAIDDADEPLGLERELDVRVAQEHERLDPRALHVRGQRALEARAQHLRLALRGAARIVAPEATTFGRDPRPVDGVALDAAGPCLELHEVDARVPEDDEIDLVEAARRRIEQVDERPEMIGIGVGQCLLGERDALALVRVRGLADSDDASSRQRHAQAPTSVVA